MTTTTPSHLGGALLHEPDSYTFMPDVWSYLIDKYKVQTVIDIGCGGGWATAWFAKQGLCAVGVEGDPAALVVARSHGIDLIEHDYTRGPLVPDGEFDLGWCAEFVEHVEDAYVDNWLATMRRCRLVCMTFATPGQGGYHHVNERPEWYWLGRFADAGFVHVAQETARLRATDPGSLYGRRTLTLFRKSMDHFYESIQGWFDFDDLYSEQVEKARVDAKFVEVGAWFGRSAAYMAVEIVRSGKPIEFYAVDTWKGCPNAADTLDVVSRHGGSIRSVFDANMKRGGVDDVVRAIEKESCDAAAEFADQSLDFVFIDATHDFEHVRNDVLAWLPKVRPGGVIAGHDALSWPGVLDAVHSVIDRSAVRIQRSSWVHTVPC